MVSARVNPRDWKWQGHELRPYPNSLRVVSRCRARDRWSKGDLRISPRLATVGEARTKQSARARRLPNEWPEGRSRPGCAPKLTENLFELHDARVGADVVDRPGLVDILVFEHIVVAQGLLRGLHLGNRHCEPEAARARRNFRGRARGNERRAWVFICRRGV